MADFHLDLISQEPYFVPSDEDVKTATLLLECFFGDDYEIEYSISEKTEFHISGANFIGCGGWNDKFTCPECGEVIKVFELPDNEDGTTWWDTLWQKLFSENTDDLTQIKIKMPCCHKEIEVTAIDFGHGEGFSKFRFRVRYVGYDGLDDKKLLALGKILGCKLVPIEYNNN